MEFIVLLGILAVALVLTGRQLMETRRKVQEVQALRDETQKLIDAAEAKKRALEVELGELKTELRDSKDENKALRKKRYDEKKPAQAQAAPSTEPASSSTDTLRLEKQWRDAVTALDAEKARAQTAEAELAETKRRLAAAEERVNDDGGLAAVKAELASERRRVQTDEKAVQDMRRKIEWYRRIYIVQQKELEKEQDKTAHVRQRFLDLCVELVELQKRVAGKAKVDTAEVERLQKEQAEYRAAQEKEAGATLQ